LKLKYSKPVILVAFATSLAILLPLANGIENPKEEVTTPLVTTLPPQTTVVQPTTTVIETTTTTTEAPVTTTTTLVPPGSKCEELAPIALAAGWPQELLVDVLDEAWQESRCLNIIDGHKNFNGHDRGPLQINQVWLNEIEAKYGSWEYVKDPYYNFAWAWEMYIWHDIHKGCGFKPWSRKCK
jgi:hypothetical protein